MSATLASFLNHLVGLACRSLCSKTVSASSFVGSTRVLTVSASAATLSFLYQISQSFLCQPSLYQRPFGDDHGVDEFSSQEPMGSYRHFSFLEHLVSYSSPYRSPNGSSQGHCYYHLNVTIKSTIMFFSIKWPIECTRAGKNGRTRRATMPRQPGCPLRYSTLLRSFDHHWSDEMLFGANNKLMRFPSRQQSTAC